MTARIVKMNIGGEVFKTKKSTLRKFEGFFKVLMETNVTVVTDGDGCITIQRDPRHFRLILKFLRHGTVRLPSTKSVVEEIFQEAQFYLLFEMMELCKARLNPVIVPDNGEQSAPEVLLERVYSQSSPLFREMFAYWDQLLVTVQEVERGINANHPFFRP